MGKKMMTRNFHTVLGRIAELIRNDTADLRKPLLYQLNEMLDGLLDSDAFGTEGQLDPRGDHREG